MISTFLVSVKMCAKVIPTKGKHILKPLSGYITEVKKKKKKWDIVGASRYDDLRPTSRCAYKIPLKNEKKKNFT